MDITTILHGVGSAGFFSSRAFVPTFATALFLRFGTHLPFLKELPLIQISGTEPFWFTHWITLTILGILALLEITGTKIPETQQILEGVNTYLKPLMAAISFYGISNLAQQVQSIGKTISQPGENLNQYLMTAGVAGGVFYLSHIRHQVLGIFMEADEDDDSGIRSLMSWAEDLWSTFGLLVLFIFPMVMLFLLGIIFVFLFTLRKYFEYREEKSKINCSQCQEPVYPSAIACQKCSTKVENPAEIGFLGQSKAEKTADLSNHPYRLVEKKRCPNCATRFTERKVQQNCSGCQQQLMADKEFAQHYLQHIDQRVGSVCFVSLGLSLIPILGLIPGVIYYRTKIVAPFRRYIPMGQSFILKWFIRILFFILIAFQWVPGLGGVVLPLMAFISYKVYRSAFCQQL